MNRITDKQLCIVRDRIAKLLGRPESNFITKPDGGLSAQVGSLLIESGSYTNGITWKLSEITNERGGEHDLLRATSARDLFNMMLAFESGIEAGRRGKAHAQLAQVLRRIHGVALHGDYVPSSAIIDWSRDALSTLSE